MAELTFPNVSNYNGIPLLQGAASVTDGKVVISLQPHKYSEMWTGCFWVKITNPVAAPASTADALPVYLNTIGGGNEYPLYRYTGAQATNSLMATSTGGIVLCFFDSATNRLQLVAIV